MSQADRQCDCDCHKSGRHIVHCVPCCEKCPYCCRNYRRVESHKRACPRRRPVFGVVYSELQVSDPNRDPVAGIISPSASKPKAVAAALMSAYPDLVLMDPVGLDREDFYRCHDRTFVDDVFAKKRANGFFTVSDSVNRSLPYTNGAMYRACQLAEPGRPACALVSGFHHAGYAGFERFGCFCTFNGLMISARKMIAEGGCRRVAIVDCDMHDGNGTSDIIKHLGCQNEVFHWSFGHLYRDPRDAPAYLGDLDLIRGPLAARLGDFRPDLILYQSGADVHVDDPMGGVLDEAQMEERDFRVFTLAKRLGVPLAWCLAGGYQVDPDGGIGTVIRLHMNTFLACERAHRGGADSHVEVTPVQPELGHDGL